MQTGAIDWCSRGVPWALASPGGLPSSRMHPINTPLAAMHYRVYISTDAAIYSRQTHTPTHDSDTQPSSGLEKHNSQGIDVEKDESPSFMRAIASVAFPHDAMPGRSILCIKVALDVTSHVTQTALIEDGFLAQLEGVFLLRLGHVDILDGGDDRWRTGRGKGTVGTNLGIRSRR